MILAREKVPHTILILQIVLHLINIYSGDHRDELVLKVCEKLDTIIPLLYVQTKGFL